MNFIQYIFLHYWIFIVKAHGQTENRPSQTHEQMMFTVCLDPRNSIPKFIGRVPWSCPCYICVTMFGRYYMEGDPAISLPPPPKMVSKFWTSFGVICPANSVSDDCYGGGDWLTCVGKVPAVSKSRFQSLDEFFRKEASTFTETVYPTVRERRSLIRLSCRLSWQGDDWPQCVNPRPLSPLETVLKVDYSLING